MPPPHMVPEAPEYLDDNLKQRWNELAPAAAASGTLTAKTADAFARYVIADQEYLRAAQRVLSALHRGDTQDAAQWSQVQDRFYKELQISGKLFGMTPDGGII